MIDINKNVISYQIEHGYRYVNKYVINATCLQIARIPLIDEKLDQQKKDSRNIILFDGYFEKLLNFNILIMF